jgi:hypothetical protein
MARPNWQCPRKCSQWSDWLAAGLHARNRWRLSVLLAGILFAAGRRTVSGWLRAVEVSADFQDYYYFLAPLGRKASPQLGFAVVEFVAALEWLSVVGLQVPVDGDIPRPTPHAFGQWVDQGVVQKPFQDQQGLGQAFVQSRHHSLIGRHLGQIAAGSIHGNTAGGGAKRDAQHDRGGAFPAVIFVQLPTERQSQRP